MLEFKVIQELKQQEKKLVDLYLSSTLNVEVINHKNEVIKKPMKYYLKKIKKSNHIEQSKLMNNYKNTAEKIILKEYNFI